MDNFVYLANSESWTKAAWLLFMLADLPRLLFRFLRFGLLRKKPFSTEHRKEEHSPGRIIGQVALQNIGYVVSLTILFYLYKDWLFYLFLALHLILLGMKLFHQIKEKNAYVLTKKGHNINDLLIKPLRMVILVSIALTLRQTVWLLGCGIVFAKWVLTRPYEEKFDVPNWFHGVLVASSCFLVLLIYPFELGIIPSDTVIVLLRTVAPVYATYVGLLAAFLGLAVKNTEDNSITPFLFSGVLLNFFSTSFILLLCILGFFVFKSEPAAALGLSADTLFRTNNSLPFYDFKRYTLFGIILSLSWFSLFFFNMTAWVISNKFKPAFMDLLQKEKKKGKETTKKKDGHK